MREILFRAKTTVKEVGEFNNVWIEGDLITSNGKYYIHPKNNSVSVSGELGKIIVMHEVEPETISQYIGLCDKNGRNIWENDIVDMNRKGCGFKRIEKVFYEEGAFSPISVHGWECVPDADEIEVIGNIFDNPELLEVN